MFSWPAELTQLLHDKGRLQPVTMPLLRRRGAQFFGWLNPGEAFDLPSRSEPCVAGESGGYIYVLDESVSEGAPFLASEPAHLRT
jgi:hypothetical protein